MSKMIDETGNRYGRWAVLKRVENDKYGSICWLCHCDCGNERAVSGISLRSGRTKSCGCLKKERASETHTIDLVGEVFGKLTVVGKQGSNKRRSITWLCKCDCGNEAVVSSINLRAGNTRSCGCLKTFPKGVAAFNAVFGIMKRSAKRRGYTWQLTDEQVRCLTKQPCHYCGAEPSQVTGDARFNGDYVHNGLDRVDNTKGYTIDNVVTCCGMCNRAKFTVTVEEFESWVVRAYEHLMERGKK